MTPVPPGEVPAAPQPTRDPDDTGLPPADRVGERPRAGRPGHDRRRRTTGLASVLAEVGDLAAPVTGPADAAATEPTPEPSAASAGDPGRSARVVLPSGTVRRLRRRRSASALPPLPRPADIPDDVAGRVEFITVETVPLEEATDVEPPASVSVDPQPAPAEPPPAAAVIGWMPLVVLGAALICIFVLGMLTTR